MKNCKICNKSKSETAFETHRAQCKSCRSIYLRNKKLVWYARNKEYAKLKTKEWREQNAARKRAYRKIEYAKNREAAKEATRLYRINNPAKINHWARMRQLAKAKRTPTWLTTEDLWLIEQFYEIAAARTKATGILWHVDHKIPLRGKIVSGLHVPYNLQVIPESVNKVKRNYWSDT